MKTVKTALNIVFAAILTAAMCLGAVSCGNKNSDLISVRSPLQIAGIIAGAQGCDQALYPLTPRDSLFSDYLTVHYNLDAGDVGDGVVCYAEGADATEITVLLLSGSDSARKASDALKDYKERRVSALTGYMPEQAELTGAGVVVTRGAYAALFICADPAGAEKVFNSCFDKNPPELPGDLSAAWTASLSAAGDWTGSGGNGDSKGSDSQISGGGGVVGGGPGDRNGEAGAPGGGVTGDGNSSGNGNTNGNGNGNDSSAGTGGGESGSGVAGSGAETGGSEPGSTGVSGEPGSTEDSAEGANGSVGGESGSAGSAGGSGGSGAAQGNPEPPAGQTANPDSGSVPGASPAPSPSGTQHPAPPPAPDGRQSSSPETSSPTPSQSPSPAPGKGSSPVEGEFDPAAILAAWKSGDTSDLNEKNRKILDACSEVVSAYIKPGMSDYEKELTVHDWIVKWSEYDVEANNNSPNAKPDPDNDNPYGLLYSRKSICSGYSSTFQLFMDMLGIECITVKGFARNLNTEHAWNMVRLDGDWYCVDVTWDDPTGSLKADSVSHDFFNVTSQYLRNTKHIWDESQVPEATATAYSRAAMSG